MGPSVRHTIGAWRRTFTPGVANGVRRGGRRHGDPLVRIRCSRTCLCADAQRGVNLRVRRVSTHMLGCRGANGFEERSIPCVFFQPRAERTSSRSRGPRRSIGKVLASAVAAGAEFGFTSTELRRVRTLIEENREELLEAWNGHTALSADERVRNVHVSEDKLTADLMDGRTISVPLVWYPRLLDGTSKQRSNWKICVAGYGIHWPDLDEDLSTEGLLRGAPTPARSARRLTNRSRRRRKASRA
jgi:hypothetical protein